MRPPSGSFTRPVIQTNPPATNAAVQEMTGKVFTRTVDQFPPAAIVAEIDQKVNFVKLEEVLMTEGLKKFADPQKALLKLIQEKRQSLGAESTSLGRQPPPPR